MSITVPDGWWVVNFDTDPTACLSYGGGQHIYVGSENGVPLCPDATTTSDDYVTIQPLSETSWAQGASGLATGTLTVNGQLGTYVKDPGRLVVFAGLDLFVALGSADGPQPQAILHSITKVGPFETTPPIPKVALAGLVGANQGWALDDKALWLTSDGGAHWRAATPQGLAPTRINNVFFLDATHGWLTVGVEPSAPTGRPIEEIFRTDDGGLTWQSARIVLPPRPEDGFEAVVSNNATVTFVDPQYGWIEMPLATNTSFSLAVVYRTVDGGRSWQGAKAPVWGPLVFVSPTHGWTTGGVGSTMHLYETSDGGTSWRESTWPSEVADSVDGRQIFLPQHGTMTVQEWNAGGVSGPVTFYASLGGGVTQWRPVATLPTQAQVQGVAVVNESTWIVDANPSFYMTNDAGQHWTAALTTPRTGDLDQLMMANATDGWAMLLFNSQSCADGVVRCSDVDLLATHDGGVTWSPLAPGP